MHFIQLQYVNVSQPGKRQQLRSKDVVMWKMVETFKINIKYILVILNKVLHRLVVST